MGGQVRRVRLLLGVATAGLLALVAAWPSQGAVTEPAPLYLARQPGGLSSGSVASRLVAVGDGPRLYAHLLSEGESPASREVIDDGGRVVVLHPNGTAVATGAVVDPGVVQSWLKDSFAARARLVDGQVVANPSDKECWTAKQSALARLDLPIHDGTRALTLAETYAEADRRIAVMHRPGPQIPVRCIVVGSPTHRANYLHNLWHRITDS